MSAAVPATLPLPGSSTEQKLRSVLETVPELMFAVLVGSRANGRATDESDWDIAVQWSPELDFLERLGRTETLRRCLAQTIEVEQARVDLIDLRDAGLAMRAVVAEEGKPLMGEEGLAWAKFLCRTWRELEDYYWETSHAA